MTSLQDLTGSNNLFDSYTGYYDETSRVRNTTLMHKHGIMAGLQDLTGSNNQFYALQGMMT